MEKPNSRNGVSVRAYQGDAMTLLAFDLDHAKTPNFTGFSIRITPGTRAPYFMTNLAFIPKQRNGDNLIEIRDRDAVTVFAIEAIRLVDHFAFRDRKDNPKEINLHNGDDPSWFESYYDPEDLHLLERELLIAEPVT